MSVVLVTFPGAPKINEEARAKAEQVGYNPDVANHTKASPPLLILIIENLTNIRKTLRNVNPVLHAGLAR